MTQDLQNFLIFLCLLMSYPIIPTLAWQERGKHPTLAIVVIALWVFIVPLFVIGFSSTRAAASRIITAPFSTSFSSESKSDPIFQQIGIDPRRALRWDI